MIITAKFSFLIAAIAFVTAMCCINPVSRGIQPPDARSERSGGDLSFASELWKSEYLDSEDIAGGSQALATGSQSNQPGWSAGTRNAGGANAGDTNAGANSTSPHAEQLLINAAIAAINDSAAADEVDADQSVDDDSSDRRFGPMNAWQVAQARAGSTMSRVGQPLNAGGPTLTVYLVGLVAVIVLGGTLLSGTD